jgi:hypothetical protein
MDPREKFCKDIFELPSRLVDRLRVVDDEIGSVSFCFQRNLTGFPTFDFCLIPTPAGFKSAQALASRHIDVDDRVAQIVPSRLKQNGRIEQHCLFVGSLRLCDSLDKHLPNSRMNDPFEIVPGGASFVARPKDQVSQRSSVDLPGLVKHTCAKTLPDGLLRRLERQHFVTDFVPINQRHTGVVSGDPPGDCTFSRTDSPDNSDNGDKRMIWHEPNGDGQGEEIERLNNPL